MYPKPTVKLLFLVLVVALAGVLIIGAQNAGAGGTPGMYWVNRGNATIYHADLDGNSPTNVTPGAGAGDLIGVALDTVAGKMYYTSHSGSTIYQANLSGTNAVPVSPAGLSGPMGIALDPAGGKMYYVTYWGASVMRANLNGSTPESLATLSPGLVGIALDEGPANAYVTNWSASRIHRINLTTLAVTDITPTGTNGPQMIEVDSAGGKMYWANWNDGTIRRANMNGTMGDASEVLVSGAGVSQPNGIALHVSQGKMYWTNQGDNTIYRAPLNGGTAENVTPVGGVVSGPYDIALEFDAPLPSNCFATPDDGVTVFDSADAHAVQQAVDAAASGGTVKVAGTCAGTEVVAGRSQSVYISKPLTLIGGFTPAGWATSDPVVNPTTIDALALGRVIYSEADLTIKNLTLQNGNITTDPVALSGGGVKVVDAKLAMSNVHVLNSTAGTVGGGVYARGTLELNDVYVAGNTSASRGGGVYAIGSSVLSNARVENNTAGDRGGGVYVYSSGYTPAVLRNVQILTNTSSRDGGGLYAYGSAQLDGGVLQGNHAVGSDVLWDTFGGGFYVTGELVLNGTEILNNISYNSGAGGLVEGKATLQGGLFRANSSGHGGAGGLYTSGGVDLAGTRFINNSGPGGGAGGLYVSGSNTQSNIVNALFVGNQAGMDGAAISCNTTNATPGTVNIIHTTISSPTLNGKPAIESYTGVVNVTNTIITNHAAGIEADSTGGGTATEDYNLFFGNTANTQGTVASGGHSQVGDPAFVNPAGEDYHLSPASAAINIGMDAGVTTDFDGEARPQGGGFDAGFDETSAAPDLTVSKTNTVGGATMLGSTWDWRATVTNGGSAPANFADTQVLYTDTLPNTNVTYGAPSIGSSSGITGVIACLLSGGNVIVCTANGPVSIAANGSFRVDVTATPVAVGTFTNPTGGSAMADPNNNVVESDETNNDSNRDSVVVTATAPVPVPTLSEWGMLILAGLLAGYGVYALRQRPLRRRSRPQTG